MELTNQTPSNFYCSALSSQAGEDLFGTASQAEVWLLLEYNGAWGAKAFEESDLPEAVKTGISACLSDVPASRLQLIRDRDGATGPSIHFYVAIAREGDQVLYAFQLGAYEELLELDIPAIVAGAARFQAHLTEELLFLVCTNGKRDPCCARYGSSLYLALSEALSRLPVDGKKGSVWQTNHMGGHRFAANLLCFPQAVNYGRLRPEDAAEVLETCRRGEVALEHYRGRACYPKVVQAAEYYLRKRTGNRAFGAFRLVDEREPEPGQWVVRFRSQEETIHTLRIAVENTGQQLQQSCRSDKLSPLIRYRLADYAAVSIS